ncbi:MAG TPA: LPS assembly protein LptD [Rickettsiales bacterium]|nr:LPS assembly protein LptD [Rickettsiales bacterium]
MLRKIDSDSQFILNYWIPAFAGMTKQTKIATVIPAKAGIHKKLLYILAFFLLIQTSFGKEVDEKTIIKSNKINRENKNIIKAIGDVEIKKGNRILNAKEVEYNQTTKTIKANSAVKVYDEKAEILFYSKEAEVSDDFLDSDFYDSFLIFENGSNIESEHIKRLNENQITLDKGTYDLCPTNLYNTKLNYDEIIKDFENKKTSLFSLRSSKTDLNLLNKTLKLKGTSVWFWKIPIFYLPYLKLSASKEFSANGFELPGFENSKHYGYGAYISYKINSDKFKLKLTPKVYEKGNYLLNTKINLSNKDKFSFNFKNDITHDNNQSKELKNAYGTTELEEGKYKNWRGFASLDGVYNFNKLWDFTTDASIVSDRYYLRDYYQNTSSYIKSDVSFSRVDLEDNANFNYFQFSNLFYQELLENDNSYNAPKYAPVTKLNLQDTIIQNDKNNFYYKAYFNTTSLFRNTGVEYNRFSAIPSLNDNFNTNFGNINTSFELKGDLYALNEVGVETKQYRGDESRVLPQFNIQWQKNISSRYISFEPIVKYSGSPNSDSFEDKIPNEDSEPQMLSFENIFSNNRFVGYDRQEYGNRITYGFDGSLINNIGFGLAQGYRDNLNNDETLIGFEEYVSDYVGYLSYIINNNFDVYYRFLTDKNNFTFKKNEVTLNFNVKDFDFYLTYLDMKKNILYSTNQRQLTSGIYFKILHRWRISLSGTLDLKNNDRLLKSEATLRYSGNCTFWEINYVNTNPSTETDQNTTIGLTFGIKFR